MAKKQFPPVHSTRTLTSVVLQLLKDNGYNNPRCQREFGTGLTFMHELENKPDRKGRSDILQHIYESLTGVPLIPPYLDQLKTPPSSGA